jgi:integrase
MPKPLPSKPGVDVLGWYDHLLDKELSINSVANYMCTMRQFLEMYDEVTKANVMDYKRWLIDSGKAVKTINNRIIAMNQYAKYAGIPCDVKTLKQQKAYSLENVITVEQKDRLLEGLAKDRNENGWAMVMLLSMTGVRVGELVQLKKELLRQGWQLITNKGKTRKVYAPKSMVEALRGYYETTPGEYLVYPHDGDGTEPLTREAVGQRLRAYAKRYGVPVKVCHPHSFRHMFGQEFMKSNGNITLLADLMGHSNIATTQIYTRMSEDEQRKQLDEAVNW